MQYTVIMQPIDKPQQGVWGIGWSEREALTSCISIWKKSMGDTQPTLVKIRPFEPIKGEEPFVSLADARWEDLDPRCVTSGLAVRAGRYGD